LTSVVLTKAHSKWILGSICRDSADAINHKIELVFVSESRRNFQHPIHVFNYYKKLKDRDVLFMHQGIFLRFALLGNAPSESKVFVTHTSLEDVQQLKVFEDKVRTFFVMNLNEKMKLQNIGIEDSKITIVFGAVDKSIYKPSKTLSVKSEKYVAIVGNYGERKNPETIKKIINDFKSIKFMVHGNGWEALFSCGLPNNLEIQEFKLSENPKFIRNAFCYLTLSHLEGGPIPTLEALASGTPVVASNTGFNSEFIDSSNGVLLRDNQNIEEIRKAIQLSFKLKSKSFNKDLLNKDLSFKLLGSLLYL